MNKLGDDAQWSLDLRDQRKRLKAMGNQGYVTQHKVKELNDTD